MSEPRSLRDKAVAAIVEERARVLKATDSGIALEVQGSRDPAMLARPTYRTFVYRRDGALVRECSCPAIRRCHHIEAAELIWRPGPTEGSHR